MADSTTGTTSLSKEDLKKIDRLRDSIDATSKSIRGIRKDRALLLKYLTDEKDILDEIQDSEDKIHTLENKRKKLAEEIRRARGNTLKQTKLILEAKELEKEYETEITNLTKKKIEVAKEGYNELDHFEKKAEGRTKILSKSIKEIGEGVRGIGESAKKIIGPWGKMSQAAADFAKHVGLSERAMDALRKRSIELVDKNAFGIKYNVGVEQLMKLQESFTKNTGRQVMSTNAGLESMAATSKILGENTGQFMGRLENFGISMEEAGRRAGQMFAGASKKGIVWENYSKAFLDNITLAQKYNFKNGLQGLASMAEKATKINLNMSQAASFAEKVNTVEGAITTGAQLQVLGGPFAQMADPMGMLYEGLNDLEGLQDRMIKMFGNLGTFNRQTGEVEISSFNKQRIRAASQAMGLDANNIFESINSSARRNEIARQIAGNKNIDKDTAELLKNVGIIQNGKAGAVVNGRFKAAKDITSADARYLQEIARSESEDVKDIAQRLRGWEDSVQGFQVQKDATQANIVETMGIGKGVQNLVNTVGQMRGLLIAIAAGQVIGGVAGIGKGLFGMTKGVSRMPNGVKNMFSGGGLPKTISAANGNVYKRVGGKYYKQLADGTLSKKPLQGAAATSLKTRAANAKVTSFIGKGAANGGKLVKAATAMKNVANIAGLLGFFGDMAIDAGVKKNLANGRGGVKAGGFGEYAGRMGSRALEWGSLGATIGSIGGPVGTVIGAAVGAIGGAVSGAIKATKNKRLKQLSDEHGIALNGSYSAKELRKINEAFETGHLSDKLKAKMQQNGDIEAVDKINNFLKNEVVKVQVVKAQKFAGGGITTGSTSGDKSIAAVSGREMVLTQQQQAELFRAIDGGKYASKVNGEPVINAPSIEVAPASVKPGPVKIDALQFGQLQRNLGSLTGAKLAPKMVAPSKKENSMTMAMSLELKHQNEVLRSNALALNNITKAPARPNKKEISNNIGYEKELLAAVNKTNDKVGQTKQDGVKQEIKAQELVLKPGQESAIISAIKDNKTSTPVIPRVDNNINVSPTTPRSEKSLKIDFGELNINFKGDDVKITGDGMRNTNITPEVQRQLETMIAQNVTLQIKEALNRDAHAGRIVPGRGNEYSVRG